MQALLLGILFSLTPSIVLGQATTDVLQATQTVTGAKTFTSSVTVSGNGRFIGNGSLITNIASSALDSSSVTLQGNSFNAANKLTLLNGSGKIPDGLINYSSVTAQGNIFNGANQLVQLSAGGLVPLASIDYSSITARGNVFNIANRLVLLDGSGKLPALDGSFLFNLSSAAVSIDFSSVTAQGNVFNAANKLLQLDGSGLVPNTLINYSSITAQGNIFNVANRLLQLDGSGQYPLAANTLPTSVMLESENVSLLNNDAGYISSYSETDPQVGTLSTNDFGYWNGSALTGDGIVRRSTSSVNGLTIGSAGTRIYDDAILSVGGSLIAGPNGVAPLPGYAFQGSSSTGMGYVANENLVLVTNRRERVRVDTSGNMGVGTSLPGYTLDVKGAISSTATIVGAGGLQVNAALALVRGTGVSEVRIDAPTDNLSRIGLYEQGVDKWIIDNVGGSSDLFRLNSNGVSNIITATQAGLVGIGTSAPGVLLHVFSGSDTDILSLQDSDGTCNHNPESASETVSCSSDIKLKRNIRDSQGALSELLKYKVKDYEVKITSKTLTGVIAQELQQDLPQYVRQGENGTLMVELPSVWKLVKAIQELEARVKVLESK